MQNSDVLPTPTASANTELHVTTTIGHDTCSSESGMGEAAGHTAIFPTPFDDFALSGPFYESEVPDSLDWIFFGQDPTFTLQSEHDVYGNSTLGWPSLTAVGDHSTIAPSPLDQLDIPSAHQEETHEDRWPMFWRPEPSALTKLSRLGRVSHPSSRSLFYSLPSVNQGIIEPFKALLGVSELSMWEHVDLSSFPDVAQLDVCIDRYFKHFAKVYCIPRSLEPPLPFSSTFLSFIALLSFRAKNLSSPLPLLLLVHFIRALTVLVASLIRSWS